ncbi:protein kinase [Histoplasma capsulatum]|uniref:non-specific serine/threonine protein kinase n=1 Tax=Ajellomyces capsulatus TaxID=5037 RepID=A0A8A1LY08_AJECA|nr:protein kinase [Histoplasma capsulatum]
MITAADVLFMGFAFLLLLRNSISNNLTFSTTSRFFSSTDRSLLQIMWKGTQRVTKYDEMIGKSVENNSELKDRVATVEIAGHEHQSTPNFACQGSCWIKTEFASLRHIGIMTGGSSFQRRSLTLLTKEHEFTGCWRLSNTVPDVNFAGNNLGGALACIAMLRLKAPIALTRRIFQSTPFTAPVSGRGYQVVAKLGWGTSSTVWLAQDLHHTFTVNAISSTLTKGIGRPVITDFGLAVRGDVPHLYYHTIQADDYRAPEIILTAGWSYSADIWNLGVLLWDLLEKDGGFGALSPGNMEYTSERHLAHMIALLGPPPKKLLDQGHETTKYFDHDGAFRYPELIPENVSLVDSLNQIKDEDKISFLAFIMRMLRWQPEERSSAKDLLADPWLRANH